MSKQTLSAMIGETHVTRLDTLRTLCEYVAELRAKIDALQAEVDALKKPVGDKIYNDNEEAKEEKRIVADLVKGGEDAK